MEYKTEGLPVGGMGLHWASQGPIYYIIVKTDSLTPEKSEHLTRTLLLSGVLWRHWFFGLDELEDDEVLVMVSSDPSEHVGLGKRIVLRDYVLSGDSTWGGGARMTSVEIDNRELDRGARMEPDPRRHHILTWALDRIGEDDDELDSILKHWRAGDQWPAELAWWRSPNPTARKLAVALFHISYSDKDAPEFPRFEVDSNRFGTAESAQRKAEITEVLQNLQEIERTLKPMIKQD